MRASLRCSARTADFGLAGPTLRGRTSTDRPTADSAPSPTVASWTARMTSLPLRVGR